ncbi:uncharacterized protein I206_106918 [Kwoniella pini CBS 10737]|uniref:Uncharacterized protein n=1 Tax=Kwoniella pini CBS 10737 TaxID=1296096 RepID=A0A1B9HZQ1_9TREE|nr:uncharacterized protein I206_05537 [Kwoniella pini CBS 10737]OCF48756.1 hypothetical protein I206_05537 [Kwoniella pini CBS 10737]
MSFLLNSIPISLSAIGVGLLPLLFLHFRSYLSPSRQPSENALPSYFYPAVTSHGRHLPITAKNGFSYSLLYLTADIDSIESCSLDLPFRILKYGGNPITKLIGIRTKDYLSHGNQGFREKLESLLTEEKFGISREEIGKAWLITLPSLAGWEGPNPLTTWFVYRKTKDETKVGELLCLILEVHSSFGESHAYVLKPSSEYRQEPAKGYDLAFKFPRTFHVSPFNSRDGFYSCNITNPFPNQDIQSYKLNPPEFKILLKVLSSDDQVKFVATLKSGPFSPVKLEPYSIFKILYLLCKWPFTLMSVTFRTFYQAYKLHYIKKLALFPRPEHHTTGSSSLFNPPQNNMVDAGSAMQRQEIGWTEIKARKIVEKWAKSRCRYMRTDLEIKLKNGRKDLVILSSPSNKSSAKQLRHTNGIADGETNGHSTSKLIITSSDPYFFTNLLISPSPQHSLILFPEQLTSVSSSNLFEEFFSSQTQISENYSNDLLTKFIRFRRTEYWLYLYSYSNYAPTPSIPSINIFESHFSENIDLSNWKDKLDIYRVIFWFTFNEYFEKWLFNLLNAKFVKNSEPWKIWERSLKKTIYELDNNDIDGRVNEKKLGSYFID